MFPFKAKGSLQIPSTESAEQFQLTLVALLGEERPADLRPAGDAVYFSSGILESRSRESLLATISSGAVHFEKAANGYLVSYELSFMQLAVIVPVMLAIFYFCMPASVPRLYIVASTFLLVVGGNYAWALVRFRALLRRAKT